MLTPREEFNLYCYISVISVTYLCKQGIRLTPAMSPFDVYNYVILLLFRLLPLLQRKRYKIGLVEPGLNTRNRMTGSFMATGKVWKDWDTTERGARTGTCENVQSMSRVYPESDIHYSQFSQMWCRLLVRQPSKLETYLSHIRFFINCTETALWDNRMTSV